MRLIVVGSLLALAACGDTSGGDTPGISDAAISADAGYSSDGPAAPGLEVTWTAQPALPGTFASDVMVASLKLRLASLEVVGDAGSTTETTRRDFDVAWSATASPFPTSFYSAPQGVYSQVSLRIDGKLVVPSYEIEGTFLNGGVTEPFRISDTAALAVDITGYMVTLAPGGSIEVPIRVDLQDALDAVSFAMLPLRANVRTMDQDTTGIEAVRDALEATVFVRGN